MEKEGSRHFWEKFYDSNDLEKQNENYELVRVNRNGSRRKRFRKPERSDVDVALLKWFKQ